jgi:hypothetical protein
MESWINRSTRPSRERISGSIGCFSQAMNASSWHEDFGYENHFHHFRHKFGINGDIHDYGVMRGL